MTTIIRRRALAALATSVLLATACGGTADSADPQAEADPVETTAAPTDDVAAEAESAFPVTITAGNGEVTIAEQPMSIVSLSATATEILFAIGAGSQVVAVDDFSNFPPEAPVTDLSGFQPNVEAILGYEPDLVLVSFDPGDVVAGLDAAGVPTIVHDAAVTIDDTYTQIEQLGVATGNVGGAAELVLDMQTELDELIASLPQDAAGLTYYHELDNTYFSVTSSTFLGELYGLFGLENIADAADPDGDSFGYPQLSAEYVVEADPDLIFLADTKCCEVTAESVAERPGWGQMTAVTQGGVIELDDDIASRWGPRIIDLLREVAAAIEGAVAARADA